MSDTALHDLAHAAGIEINWRNIDGNASTVSNDSLRAVLAAIGFPGASLSQIRESLEILQQESNYFAYPLITADLNRPVSIAGVPGRFRITLESGFIIEGMAKQGPNGTLTQMCIRDRPRSLAHCRGIDGMARRYPQCR